MLMSVLLISSAVLGAATIAGLLVLFQLRQTADAEASAQAIFASDAGIERALYAKYQLNHCAGGEGPDITSDEGAFAIGDDIEYRVVFEDGCNIGKSGGRSGRAARALIIYFQGIENFGGQFIGP